MPPGDFALLNNTLYGNEHGLGERMLNLKLSSREKGLQLKMPVVCKYKDNMPSLVTDRVSKEKWLDLYHLVREESTLKISFSNGSSRYVGRIAHKDVKPLKQDRIKMEFRWLDEEEDAAAMFKEGISWITSRLC